MRKICLTAALAALVTTAYAQEPKPSPATDWYRAGHVTLRVSDAAQGMSAAWQFDRADNGDNRIVRDERRGEAAAAGTVISVCDDRALLMNGLKPGRGREMREIDEPVLVLQMVLRVLARAAPEGPAALAADKLVEIGDKSTPIRVRKGLEARRDFNAPWLARGRLKREAGGAIAFDIVFTHAGDTAGDARPELGLAGVWRQNSGVASFADAMPIADWQVFRVNAVAVTTGGSTHIESMSTTKPLRYATLGHLRRHIERDWSMNPKVAPILECQP
jgi:hypothetical protein